MNDKEIGGFIEFDSWKRAAIHQEAVSLNCARNCLLYIARAREIERILLPEYLCDSVSAMCDKYEIGYRYYQIDSSFRPIYDYEIFDDEYFYLVDYFGQLTSLDIERAKNFSNGRLIVDEAQGFFRQPWADVDTLYSVRKFLGVTDGAFLYTTSELRDELPVDESYSRTSFLFGRLEKNAQEFYRQYQENNDRFSHEPLKQMSELTRAFLGVLDYERIKLRREKNYRYLSKMLDADNKLNLHETPGPFAYPFMSQNGAEMRKIFAEHKIYVPTLWPNVLESGSVSEMARNFAQDILPLPIDQRYGYREMNRICEELYSLGAAHRELDGKKLAILGGTLISCEIVKAAHALGVETFVIDYNSIDESPAKQIANNNVQISVADIDAVVSYLEANKIDGVLCGYSDSILGYYAQICAKAGLPCYGTEALFDLYTDKKKWKDACEAYDIPTGKRYKPEILSLPESECTFPLFIKPSIGSGARGTGIARTKDELLKLYEIAKGISANSEVTIEEYLEGPEVTVFWLMIDGKYYVSQIGNRLVKDNQEGVIPLPTGYSFPSSVIPLYLKEIAPKVKRMFMKQGIKNGMMFMQCIVKEGIPYVYDIGFRTTGSLEHYLQKNTAGYSSMDMLIRYALTKKMNTDDDIEDKIKEGLYAPCFNVSCLMAPGTIERFEGLDEVGCDTSVLAVVKAHVENETLPPEAKGELRQIAVRVLGMVPSSGDIAHAMLDIQRRIRIISSEGEDLQLPGFTSVDVTRDILDCRADWQG